jgi:hypothetical protein
MIPLPIYKFGSISYLFPLPVLPPPLSTLIHYCFKVAAQIHGGQLPPWVTGEVAPGRRCSPDPASHGADKCALLDFNLACEGGGPPDARHPMEVACGLGSPERSGHH